MAEAEGIIRRGNAHEFVATVKKRSTDKGKPVQAEGLSLSGYLSTTEEGTAIDGTTTNLTARTDPEYDDQYAGTLAASAVDAAIASLSEVWEVVVGTNLRRARLLRVVGSGSD